MCTINFTHTKLPPWIYQKFASWKTQRKRKPSNRDLNRDWMMSCYNGMIDLWNFVYPYYQLGPLTIVLSITSQLFLLSCFFGWMGDRVTFDALFNDIVDLHLSSLGTFVPEGPCGVFYATRRQVYWGLTHVIFCCYSDLTCYLIVLWICTCRALVPFSQKDLVVCFMQQGVKFAEV